MGGIHQPRWINPPPTREASAPGRVRGPTHGVLPGGTDHGPTQGPRSVVTPGGESVVARPQAVVGVPASAASTREVASTAVSSRRDLMSSFVKTLRRCHSTVWWLRKSSARSRGSSSRSRPAWRSATPGVSGGLPPCRSRQHRRCHRTRAARGAPAPRTPRTACGRTSDARFGGAHERRRAAGCVAATRHRAGGCVRPRRSLCRRLSSSMATRYRRSTSSPSASRARLRAWMPRAQPVPAASRELDEPGERLPGLLRLPAPDGRLDVLDQREACEVVAVVVDTCSGRGQRLVVASEAVVEDALHVPGDTEQGDLTVFRRVNASLLEDPGGRPFVASPRSQDHRRVPVRGMPGGDRDRVGLLDHPGRPPRSHRSGSGRRRSRSRRVAARSAHRCRGPGVRLAPRACPTQAGPRRGG